MAKIIVAGLINIETTLKIDGFPIEYAPVRYPFHGIRSSVSGVGYNVAKALTTLGHQVDFLSMVGDDLAASLVRSELTRIGIADHHVGTQLTETPQSVVLYDDAGQRAIHTDLKSIQQTPFPLQELDFATVEMACLTNINFSRPMLEQAHHAGVPIATDIHVIRNLDDPYNQDYMAAAHILFMSDEGLPMPPHEWAKALQTRYGTPIVGIGLGSRGALLAVLADQYSEVIPATSVRPIVNTVGAGDALFSAFVHGYITSGNPVEAMKRASVFAGYKIGTRGAGEGFLRAAELEALYQKHPIN